jgi:hypothetical protein
MSCGQAGAIVTATFTGTSTSSSPDTSTIRQGAAYKHVVTTSNPRLRYLMIRRVTVS